MCLSCTIFVIRKVICQKLQVFSTPRVLGIPVMGDHIEISTKRLAPENYSPRATTQHCWCDNILNPFNRTLTCDRQTDIRKDTADWKFGRGLGQILHDELHWLQVPDRVFFKLAVTVHRCLNSFAPPYLSDYCVLATGDDTWQHLRSANHQLLAVPRYRLNTCGC